MKIAFITIHVGYNFGSVFQTIATNRILEEQGADSICINYIPPRVTEKRYWHEYQSNILRLIRRMLFFPVHYISKKKYNNYIKKHCPLTEPIYAEDNFKEKCPKADYYITGSDQVWNYKHNEGIDKHYFFDGIEGMKIAFSSSIGMTELPEDYVEYMKNKLNEYQAISVREKSAVDLLSNWGIDSVQLIDPTLMLNKETWANYASKRIVKENYVFVYLPYNTSNKEEVYDSVRKIAVKNNLKVVASTWNHESDRYADKTITFADPGDILSLLLYATFVVTNSFHGTAFSINLNKQFWVYMPSHFSTRLLSILELCGLKDRMIEGVIDDLDINKEVDFTEANRVLNAEREKAKKFITKVLS